MHALVRDRIYKGYRLVNHGYYQPDRCRWWQAEKIQTGEADFHAHTMRDLKAQIDEANSLLCDTAKEYWCIREPDDRCIDCSPNCANCGQRCWRPSCMNLHGGGFPHRDDGLPMRGGTQGIV